MNLSLILFFELSLIATLYNISLRARHKVASTELGPKKMQTHRSAFLYQFA